MRTAIVRIFVRICAYFRGVGRQSDFLKALCFQLQSSPESIGSLIRNQQVAGSIPAGGSSLLNYFCP